MAVGDTGIAAIAGDRAATHYGLGIVFSLIQDDPHNRTRFVMIGKEPTGASGYDQTSLIVSVWFFGGLIMLTLGVIGIYVANVLAETQRRPYTAVRKVHRAEITDAAGVLTVLPRRKRSDGGLPQ